MSRRPLILATLFAAMTALAACGDNATPTQPSSIRPTGQAALDVVDPSTCRGGWNSSTGRCN